MKRLHCTRGSVDAASRTFPWARAMGLLLLLTVVIAISCARVPPEAVRLSQVIGKDLKAVHNANRELAKRYFGRMRADVESFVDGTYRPFIIRKSMDDLDLINKIKAATQPGAVLDPVDIMVIYAEEAIKKVEKFRKDMLSPIIKQETSVLDDIDQAFRVLREANDTVTAHLTSIRKVHEAQQSVLEKLGIKKDLRERISSTAAEMSGQLNTLLEEAKGVDAKIEALPGKVNKLMELFSGSAEPAVQGDSGQGGQ